MEVKFYDIVDDSLLRFAVIIAKSGGRFVFCRHKERQTWEIPGGHREPGEDILTTARRELFEETGATDFIISPVCVYSVVDGDSETFGMLYSAEITAFGELPAFEIAQTELMETLPEQWTYPQIQPKLFKKACAAQSGRQL